MDDIIDMVQAFMDNCTPRCFYYYYLNFFKKKMRMYIPQNDGPKNNKIEIKMRCVG